MYTNPNHRTVIKLEPFRLHTRKLYANLELLISVLCNGSVNEQEKFGNALIKI